VIEVAFPGFGNVAGRLHMHIEYSDTEIGNLTVTDETGHIVMSMNAQELASLELSPPDLSALAGQVPANGVIRTRPAPPRHSILPPDEGPCPQVQLPDDWFSITLPGIGDTVVTARVNVHGPN
jgi:hypothetical protein